MRCVPAILRRQNAAQSLCQQGGNCCQPRFTTSVAFLCAGVPGSQRCRLPPKTDAERAHQLKLRTNVEPGEVQMQAASSQPSQLPQQVPALPASHRLACQLVTVQTWLIRYPTHLSWRPTSSQSPSRAGQWSSKHQTRRLSCPPSLTSFQLHISQPEDSL